MTTRGGKRTLLPLTLNLTTLFAAILGGDQTPNASKLPLSPVDTESFSGWDLHVEQAAAAANRGSDQGQAGGEGRPTVISPENKQQPREEKKKPGARHNKLRVYTYICIYDISTIVP